MGGASALVPYKRAGTQSAPSVSCSRATPCIAKRHKPPLLLCCVYAGSQPLLAHPVSSLRTSTRVRECRRTSRRIIPGHPGSVVTASALRDVTEYVIPPEKGGRWRIGPSGRHVTLVHECGFPSCSREHGDRVYKRHRGILSTRQGHVWSACA